MIWVLFLLPRSPWLPPGFAAFLWISNVLPMIFFIGSRNCFYCCCLFVCHWLTRPCEERYYTLFVDKKIRSSEYKWSVKVEWTLKSRCPDSKSRHSADVCCTLTLCQVLVNDMDGKPRQGRAECGLHPADIRTIWSLTHMWILRSNLLHLSFWGSE